MVRRTIALALAGLALAAPPALADHGAQWHSQMKSAADTASRTAGGCSIKAGWHQSLVVACTRKQTASLVYAFPVSHSGQGPGKVQGTPTCGVSWWGRANVHRSVKVVSGTLRVTVTVSDGTAQLNSVSVGYYA
jgi:hypothetical protein